VALTDPQRRKIDGIILAAVHKQFKEMQLLDFLASQIALNYRRVQIYQKFEKINKETQSLKDQLGQSDQETAHLKKQIVVQEKFATIGKLAGGIAHEFNNPLDGVMRYTNLCLEHIDENEVVRGYLLEIKYGLNRMANIVKNLLACCRNEFPDRENVDFEQALNHVLGGMSIDISHKNIVIERDIESKMPHIQDLGLERILTNLFRNAVDAIDADGKIRIRAGFRENVMTIEISDTGRGIPQEQIEKIFDPFFTTKEMDKGCGLGLTIVAEIVKSYNGKIHVESELGQGATFVINLPIEKGR